MTDEDIVAAKLKGYNALIKFKDGEELLIKVLKLDSTEDDQRAWMSDVEDFINSTDTDYFPLSTLSVARDAIKYVKHL